MLADAVLFAGERIATMDRIHPVEIGPAGESPDTGRTGGAQRCLNLFTSQPLVDRHHDVVELAEYIPRVRVQLGYSATAIDGATAGGQGARGVPDRSASGGNCVVVSED